MLLSLDTTSELQTVALGEPGRLWALSLDRIRTSHTETLLAHIDAVLRRHRLTGPELAGIAVVTGPGSFTGIRIGLATALGLADSWQKPMLGRNAIELLASHPAAGTGFVCPVLHARREQLFLAVFHRGPAGLVQVADYREASAPEVPALLALYPGATLLGSGVPVLQARHPALAETCRLYDGPELLPAAVLALEQPPQSWPGPPVEAFYIRPPDIRKPKHSREP